jgi:hypothetical protein
MRTPGSLGAMTIGIRTRWHSRACPVEASPTTRNPQTGAVSRTLETSGKKSPWAGRSAWERCRLRWLSTKVATGYLSGEAAENWSRTTLLQLLHLVRRTRACHALGEGGCPYSEDEIDGLVDAIIAVEMPRRQSDGFSWRFLCPDWQIPGALWLSSDQPSSRTDRMNETRSATVALGTTTSS